MAPGVRPGANPHPSSMREADDFCVAAGSYLRTTETDLQKKEEIVHAALVSLTIDPEQAPAAAGALTDRILPAIRSAPGFVAGYWLEPIDGAGLAFVVFETDEQARRSASPAGDWD